MNLYQDDPEENHEDTFDEYTTRDEPAQPSFYDRYGHDERDGPPEEEEERCANRLMMALVKISKPLSECSTFTGALLKSNCGDKSIILGKTFT